MRGNEGSRRPSKPGGPRRVNTHPLASIRCEQEGLSRGLGNRLPWIQSEDIHTLLQRWERATDRLSDEGS